MSDRRIVSLVPSLTELIVDLGLEQQLIGRTRFCIHPVEVLTEVPVIGGTKNPDIQKIKSLKPDLVITNKEENRKEDVEALAEFSEVIVTEIDTVEDALLWIDKLEKKLQCEASATKLIQDIQKQLPNIPDKESIPTAYFIWKDPWMTIGNDTYIHDVMNKFGLLNVFGDETRYPQTTLSELKTRHPELILLSSEPYPFKEKHINEIRTVLPDTKIQLIDGEWFSWYGSRMLPSFKSLRSWKKKLNES